MTAIERLVEDIGGAIQQQPQRPSFVQWRFPYTYAYDYLRSHCGLLDLSHAECAYLVRDWCERDGTDPEVMCIALAYAYMNAEGIQKNR